MRGARCRCCFTPTVRHRGLVVARWAMRQEARSRENLRRRCEEKISDEWWQTGREARTEGERAEDGQKRRWEGTEEARGSGLGHDSRERSAPRQATLLSHRLSRYLSLSPSLPPSFDPDAHVPSPMVLTSAFSELLGYISIACWVGAQFP